VLFAVREPHGRRTQKDEGDTRHGRTFVG
jgi:hypothetical protein